MPSATQAIQPSRFDRVLLALGCGIVVVCCAVAIVVTMYVNSSGGIELTKQSWERQSEGKTVFVKFQAPW